MTTDVLVSPGESGYDCVMARKKTPKHGGFRKIELSNDVEFHPDRAKEEIKAKYREAGANLHRAAELLKVTERTLHRWVDRLDMRKTLETMTADAVKKGWLNERRRPKKAA